MAEPDGQHHVARDQEQPYGELGYRHEQWNNVEGYKVDLDAVRSWGVPLTLLDDFIAQHRDKFVIG